MKVKIAEQEVCTLKAVFEKQRTEMLSLLQANNKDLEQYLEMPEKLGSKLSELSALGKVLHNLTEEK